MADMTRRQFVVLTAAAAATLGCACGSALCSQAEALDMAPSAPVDVGTLTDYSKDGITDTWVKSNRIYVVRENKRIFALDATCTHKNNPTKLRDGTIVCPSHGSRFSPEGKVDKGPARRPLAHLGIKQDDSGKITVDPSKRFEEAKWDDAGAFIKIT
jgi:Rieske Fe-S protein